MLHLAQDRYQAVLLNLSLFFHLNSWMWLVALGSAAAAGFLFCLAASFPFARVRYLPSRLLFAALASLPLAQFWVAEGYLHPRGEVAGGWFTTTYRWFGEPGIQFAFAVLVGVGLASGLQARGTDE